MGVAWSEATRQGDLTVEFSLPQPGGASPYSIVYINISNIDPIDEEYRLASQIQFMNMFTTGGADELGQISLGVIVTPTNATGSGDPDGRWFYIGNSQLGYTLTELENGFFGIDNFICGYYDPAGDDLPLPLFFSIQASDGAFDSWSESPGEGHPDFIAPPHTLTAVYAALPIPHVHLEWVDASNNEDGFIVERSEDSGESWYSVATVPDNVQVFDDYEVIEGTPYQYRAFAFIAAESQVFVRSAYSNIAVLGALVTLLYVTPGNSGILGGDLVSLIGTGFIRHFGGTIGTRVFLDGAEVLQQDIEWIDGTELQITTLPHAEGTINVRVLNADNAENTLVNAMTYVAEITTPGVMAGGPDTLQGPLPAKVITEDARSTRGMNNGATTYEWTADATNPAATTFSAPDQLVTEINFPTYVPGTYRFYLTITDEGANFVAKSTRIIVVPEAIPPRIHMTATTLMLGP